ncbi:MAG: TlpA disulfide reductase family protein [Terracidiphilus sp.]|jgi:thiol-disulfide isomerase/thioredoxin
MKNRFLVLLAAAALLIPTYRGFAAGTNAAAASDLKDLITRIQTSLQAGQKTEAGQADNIKQFDALLAKYKGDTSDDVARILYMKATLYLQIFKNTDKGTELLKQLQHDFPDSTFAKGVDQMIATAKIQAGLVKTAAFPDFNEQDLDGKPLSVASYKGKVVMVDFWATWCSPCRAEVPNVVKAYQKYHDKGFEIIGISLDQAGAKDKLTTFMKDNNMAWRQYYDGGFWTNKLAVKYGIQSIPQAFLLDRDGKILAQGESIRGDALDPAIAKALGIN